MCGCVPVRHCSMAICLFRWRFAATLQSLWWALDQRAHRRPNWTDVKHSMYSFEYQFRPYDSLVVLWQPWTLLCVLCVVHADHVWRCRKWRYQ